MKVLIVDDEPLARRRLARLLEDIADLEVCAEAENGLEAIAMAEMHRPDLILLDIRMPGMDGLEAARHLQKSEQPPAIVFTTAFDDHALAAFDIHAVDYLLKPIRKQRLEEALSTAKRKTRAQLSAVAQSASSSRQHLCARVRGNLLLIAIDDIYYFLADQKYVTVRHSQGETLIDETLKDLEVEFNREFVRIHRNALVAQSKIKGLLKRQGKHFLSFLDIESDLEISRRHLPSVRKILQGKQS